jgi:hypothetical protein
MIDVVDQDLDWTDEEIDAFFEPKPVSQHDQAILDSLEPIDFSKVSQAQGFDSILPDMGEVMGAIASSVGGGGIGES